MAYRRYYNVENKEITVAECTHCGNQVDVTDIYCRHPHGLKSEYGFNPLIILRHISTCCRQPDYTYMTEED